MSTPSLNQEYPIAFNSTGIYNGGAGQFYPVSNNILHHPAGYNYEGTNEISEISNFLVDPRFANRTATDYHLKGDSPGIDKGKDSEVEDDWTDLEGNERITRLHVDIGAYELPQAAARPSWMQYR